MENAMKLFIFARAPQTALLHRGQVSKEARFSALQQQPPHVLVTESLLGWCTLPWGSWGLLLPVSLPPSVRSSDPLGSWHFAWVLQLDRAVAQLLVLNKMLVIKLSWATLPGAASWQSRLWKAARKVVQLCSATVSCILFHLLSKAERQAPLQDLVCFGTFLLSGGKWHTRWARRAWPCWRIMVLFHPVPPSSCIDVITSDWGEMPTCRCHSMESKRKYILWSMYT